MSANIRSERKRCRQVCKHGPRWPTIGDVRYCEHGHIWHCYARGWRDWGDWDRLFRWSRRHRLATRALAAEGE